MRITGSRHLRCQPRGLPGYRRFSFLLLRELEDPLKQLLKDFGFEGMLREIRESFSRLPRREQERRYRSMSQKWPLHHPDYRSPGDRRASIRVNAALLHWLESKEGARPQGGPKGEA